ncbi:MAG: nucleoside hydrolase [Clostridia bacterium]|jgi:purine nucleosidase|nr:nucleoside hydrolase [Clostridiaceae bacterium]
MDNARIIERITQRPSGKLDMVLDTDTYNEIDDQFAVCYALCAEDKLNVKAIYAAPFFNSMSTGPKDGMEKSYEEILKLLNSMGRSHENFVFKGSDRYLENRNTPCDNPAVRDLIEKALAQPEDRPLYVATIGAITNIASAILIEPRIIEKIVVVWLGGHTHSYPHTKEFNMYQDKTAANVVFDSKVPLVQIPCMGGVASRLITTLYDLSAHLKGKNKMCDTLLKIYEGCASDHFGYGRVIWDISTVAWLINPSWVPGAFVSSPIVNENDRYSFDPRRHLIYCAYDIDRNAVFKDMYERLIAFK